MRERILVPIDLSHQSSWCEVLKVASRLAKSRRGRLHAVNVITDPLPVLSGLVQEHMHKADLREVLDQCVDPAVPREVHAVIDHPVERTVERLAERRGIDLIVMAACHSQAGDKALGSTTCAILEHANRPVMTVRTGRSLLDGGDGAQPDGADGDLPEAA